jgi:hypothetical protein
MEYSLWTTANIKEARETVLHQQWQIIGRDR